MMGGMGGMMGTGWLNAPVVWVGFLLSLGLLAFVVVGLIAAIRWLMHDANAPGASREPDRALHIVRDRYARGEISREEFERLRQDLS